MVSTKKNQLKRNERERRRVHQVNDGFDMLRTRLQKPSSNKKLSKADTLREAVKYIRHLQSLLETANGFPTNEFTSTSNFEFPMKEEMDMYYPAQYQSNMQSGYSSSTNSSSSCLTYNSMPCDVAQYSPPQSTVPQQMGNVPMHANSGYYSPTIYNHSTITPTP